MSDFTFLTYKQCFEDDKLEILEKRGTQATITDFSILLGIGVPLGAKHIDNDSSLEGRTGDYWTKSGAGHNNVYIVMNGGSDFYVDVSERNVGARIVLSFKELGSIPTNCKNRNVAKDGILEVEYGYYPQKAVFKDFQEELEIAYKNGAMLKTSNSYTTDSILHSDEYTQICPKTHQEYMYNGKRYVRVEAHTYYHSHKKDNKLSNGERYGDGDNVWVEVSPVKWLVDEKSSLMITEKIIFAGVQFNYWSMKGNYHTRDFNSTNIKIFMDKYLSKELFQV